LTARCSWSDEFVEIRGSDAPPGDCPNVNCTTRMKMLWDDQFLYIAALMGTHAGSCAL
jgi:hypothetical protein